MSIFSYRDTPKRGETDAKWCAYTVQPNGHITRPGVIGYETEREARAALGETAEQWESYRRTLNRL